MTCTEMLEAGVKFDADYMSIQDGQTITARNELLSLLTVFRCSGPPPPICQMSPASVAPEIVTTLATKSDGYSDDGQMVK